MNRYSTVFFDLYGTLVDIRTEEQEDSTWQRLRDFCEEHGARYSSLDQMRSVFGSALGQQQEERESSLPVLGPTDAPCPRRVDSFDPRWIELDVAPAFSRLLQAGGVEAAPDSDLVTRTAAVFRLASIRRLRLYPGADDLLRALSRHGISPVLVSNAQRLYTMPELKRLGIADLFDRIFISSDFGWRKPSPAFFGHALDETGADPTTTVMVGNDAVNDIQGAWYSGLDSVFLRTQAWPGNDVFPAPHALRSLRGADYRALLRFVCGESEEGPAKGRDSTEDRTDRRVGADRDNRLLTERKDA